MILTIAIIALGACVIAYAQHRARQDRNERQTERDIQYFDHWSDAPRPMIRASVMHREVQRLDNRYELDNRLADPPEYLTDWRTT